MVPTSEHAPVRRLAVIGVGLMGGSLALAARRLAGVDHVAGYDTDPAALEQALAAGVITESHASARDAAADADLVVISTPVRSIPSLIEECLAADPRPRVISDMGSTKTAVLAGLSVEGRRRFVGGHPICGAERAGVRYARPELFDGATYFLCGTADGLPEAYELLHTFVARIGARPVAIGVDAHDRIMALVSHVPHVLANIIMTAVGEYEADGRRALFSVGPSFNDLTRVAGANPRMWRDIYLENREALVTSLEAVRNEIDEFCAALRLTDETRVMQHIATARSFRTELLEYEDIAPATLYRIIVRIPDEPGVLSRVMTVLGNANVNIEDLTLHHFSRAVGGDLELFVSGEEQATAAAGMLEELGYRTIVSYSGDPEDRVPPVAATSPASSVAASAPTSGAADA